MFATSLIVFRETLEAALFVGVVAASTRLLPGRARYLAVGVALGVGGALGLALAADAIAQLADGIGQDLVNALVLAAALSMLLWHCIWMSSHGREMATTARSLGHAVVAGQARPWALLVAVGLAVLREGAETVLFVAGTLSASGPMHPSVVVLAVGVGIAAGVVAGFTLYVGLSRIPVRHVFRVTNVLVALLAAAIASQLAKTLSQAGIIERWTTPLWDTSRLLAVDSPLGVLLHALAGYDAQPSSLQLAFYVAALALIIVSPRLLDRSRRAPHL